MKRKEKRFITLLEEGAMPAKTILVDKETGINYLFVQSGYSGGLTPLLDKEGKPIITSLSSLEE